jgi:6-phosphofructokinase 1
VAGTDVTFGFDTAVSVATEAIDRLHTTATSHDRIIVVEVMGNSSGWLALGAGIAGGADVILIPEIPYDIEAVTEYLLERQRRYGRKFSIVVVAEGALSSEEAAAGRAVRKKKSEVDRDDENDLNGYKLVKESLASSLARRLQVLTHAEARVTSLGHVQRGGVPSATDRLIATQLGVKAAELLASGTYNVMVALRDGNCVPVPLEEVAGRKKLVTMDHPWIETALSVGTCLGVTRQAVDQLR